MIIRLIVIACSWLLGGIYPKSKRISAAIDRVANQNIEKIVTIRYGRGGRGGAFVNVRKYTRMHGRKINKLISQTIHFCPIGSNAEPYKADCPMQPKNKNISNSPILYLVSWIRTIRWAAGFTERSGVNPVRSTDWLDEWSTDELYTLFRFSALVGQEQPLALRFDTLQEYCRKPLLLHHRHLRYCRRVHSCR